MFKFFKKENIFTDTQRKKLLKITKPLMVTKFNSPTMKGLSTRGDLHKLSGFKFYVNKLKSIIEKQYKEKFTIFKCWGRYTQGDHLNFHSHVAVDLTLNYYLKNSSGLGTLVRTKNEEINLGGKENSLAVFNASLLHSVPDSSDKLERYTFIVDLNIKNNA
tara:strand:+ start:267 stop:749 length:483 start_codon:yes stop_codon:yes gene_type:complete